MMHIIDRLIQLAVDGNDIQISKENLKVMSGANTLSDTDRFFLTENKKEILFLLKHLNASSVKQLAYLSHSQGRLWLVDQVERGHKYNMPMTLKLEGSLNIDALKEAFDVIIARHQVLRTNIKTLPSGEPIQVIRSDYCFFIPLLDYSKSPEDAKELAVAEHAKTEAVLPFNIDTDLMIRAQLLKCSETAHVLLVTMHHIAADGWSQNIMVDEFSKLYQAFISDLPNPLDELRIQYADYAHWQRNFMQGDVLDKQLQFWKEKLNNLPEVHNLPLDHPRPSIQNYQGATYQQVLGSKIKNGLNALLRKYNVTLYMILNAAFAVFLSRHSNQTDIVIGTSVANRDQSELAPLVGFFVNTLALRTDLSDCPSFEVLLARTKDELLDAYEHQQLPLDKLVDELRPERSQSYSPLFQVMLDLQNNEKVALELPGLSLGRVEYENSVARFELTLSVSESNDGIITNWEYATSLFESSTIEKFAKRFEVILKSIIDDPQASVTTLAMLTDEEENQLLVSYNQTRVEYPKERLIHELIESQAQLTPEKLAIIFEGRELTYRQLNESSNQLAGYLKKLGVGVGTLVGISVTRSPEMMIAMLAILKSGGAYVPIDPNYPTARLQYILEDTQLKLLITLNSLASKFIDNKTINLIELDSEACQTIISESKKSNLNRSAGQNARNQAYVIYTSGSTGKPNGVLISHQGLVNYLDHASKQYLNQHIHGSVVSSPLSFDATITTLFSPLLVGKFVKLLPEDDTILALLKQCLFESKIPLLFKITPAHLEALEHLNLNQVNLKTAHTIVIGGEQLETIRLSKWKDSLLKNAVFINEYGPTETVVGCSWFVTKGMTDSNGSSQSAVPIGKAIQNSRLYVLGKERELLPSGSVGELYIGGDGVAIGYLNRAAITKQRFVQNPFSQTQDRLYKTGDLVRHHDDGTLEFVGRVDDQVKIRGYRIELGEIESIITEQNDVVSALVVAYEDEYQEKRLVAYLIKSDQNIDDKFIAERVKKHLEARLPDFMIPSIFKMIEFLPLTHNGKIDRNSLPSPILTTSSNGYLEPKTSTERVLTEIWSKLLKVTPDSIGITDNFFDLGGHSLLAVRLIAAIRTELKQELPIEEAFNSPDIKRLAKKIDLGQNAEFRRVIMRVGQANKHVRLSYAQERLWFLDKMSPGGTTYNVSGVLQVDGLIDLVAAEQAITQIIRRHSILRTVYNETDDEVVQIVNEEFEFILKVKDLCHLDSVEKSQQLKSLTIANGAKGFDLSVDVMLRVTYLKLDDEQGMLLFDLHHIASDGWSMTILINEFCALYTAYQQSQKCALAPLEIQYSDYAFWQRDWLQGKVLTKQLDYWTNQLANLPVVHSLALDNIRPTKQSFVGKTHYSNLNQDRLTALTQFCKGHSATLFMGLHAAFSVLLSRYSNETDIVIGSPIANREQAEIAPLIGCFVNSLVLRSDLSNNPSFNELVQQSKQMLLEAFAHQQVPFEQIVEKIQPERSLSHSPLFQVMLVLQNNEEATLELHGIKLSPVEQEVCNAKFDLTLTIVEAEQGLSLGWKYNTDLFRPQTIARMASHFESLLRSLLQTPGQNVYQSNMLTKAEIDQQLIDWNETLLDTSKDKCIHELFEQKVEKQPDCIAVLFQESHLTYEELNNRANQLARYLISEKQVKPDSLVGVCVERSIEMVVAILAILKAGGAYVPLDPNYPNARLSYMLKDANLTTVITQQTIKTTVINDNQAIYLNSLSFLQELSGYSTENICRSEIGLSSNHLANIIYTSGSTGEPKGVMVEHRSLVNYLYALRPYCDEVAGSFVTTNICFDGTATSFWLPLVVGKYIKLASSSETNSLNELLAEASDSRESKLFKLTPSHLELLSTEKCGTNTNHIFFIGGEIFSADKYQRLPKNIKSSQFFNHYGPSEAAVGCAIFPIPSDYVLKGGSIPLGKPIKNVHLCVLDAHGQIPPVGVIGELHIGGECLARGYLNKPDLTAQKFISNPYHDHNNPASPKILYKTGDLARWLPDGNLEFAGRLDHQIKIRGFRIELGEIEHTIGSCDGVNQTVVIAKENDSGDKRLVAYVTTANAVLMQEDVERTKVLHQHFIESIRQTINQNLPEYMMPSAFVLLDDLPLTANGKLDRKALPEPDMSLQQSAYVEPSTDTEKVLCEIWQDILGLERVGITDNFFELGGHSLLIMKFLTMCRIKYKTNLQIKDVFECRNLSDLANLIDVMIANNKNSLLKETVLDGLEVEW